MTTNQNDITAAKEQNNDWSNETTLWGAGFEIEIVTEGNEAEGEVPATNAWIAAESHLKSDDCPLEPGDQPNSFTDEKTTRFVGDQVEMFVTMKTMNDELMSEYEPLVETVEDVIPDDWEGGL